MKNNGKETVLIVDDHPDNLLFMSELIKDDYNVKVANNGQKALQIAQSTTPPDLILLDIMMPEMDGYEVCRRLKEGGITKAIPIIFLTAKSEERDEQKGLAIGAVDYITKPISPPIVLARIQTHLQLKAAADFLKDKNLFLESEVARRTQEIVTVQAVTIDMMTSLTESRDKETGYHIQRTQFYIKKLAEKLKSSPRFKALLTDDVIELLFNSAPLHDIGKIGVPDRILLKPGKLDKEEFEMMKGHTTIGYEVIDRAERKLGQKIRFLMLAKEIALAHHERWDGTGYPHGLKGDDIPVAARLMSVADVYDALVCKRIYKPAIPHEQAVSMIREGRGSQFDPDIVDAFSEISGEFQQIAIQYLDD
jgi:putative two-component system response regulator